MIHFFPIFSKDAGNSPFARELQALGVQHRLFSGEVLLRYRSRIWLLLVGWPKLAWFALNSAMRSLVLSNPHPDTVVVGSHIEVLVFGFFRAVFFRKKPSIVLLGFILTARKNAISNQLRSLYFRFVFSIVDQVICHSSLEVERYKKLFSKSRANFEYVPYGLHIGGREVHIPAGQPPATSRPYILAAGRSGRDYATLFQAVETLDVDLHLVCDSGNAIAGLKIPNNVSILGNCYDDDYVNELRNALFVVIPLAVDDISAGQMVLIQAMAFAKPTVITRTVTVEEYVANGEQSLLVSKGSVVELQSAIRKLLYDHVLAARLSSNAVATFENKFCMRAYVARLVNCVSANS